MDEIADAAAGEPVARVRAGLVLPSLGRYLRWVRESRGLSREKAAGQVPLSAVYLAMIESERRMPTRKTLGLLAAGYGLDDAQTAILDALHAPSLELAAAEELRARVRQEPQLLLGLADLDSVGLIAAYLDPAWNVLAANDSFRRALPGLAEAPVGAAWFFGPVARRVLADWEHEATLCVRLLKGDLARFRGSLNTWRLLQQLGRDDDFHRLWSTDSAIASGRSADDLMRLREFDSGHPYTVSIQTSRLDSHTYIRHFLGIRKPDSGTTSR